ncbi:single-stranded DNA-binding protein-like [Macrosteles quadrilineatus]|uniref:single-stranded DNA-binding protein-like n=1 Tax=Macrosteles quadrilineatus TaxID=74068 RepID=UPI0023E2646B|nr:single-stranded DNA-binding protein-like [Macrosteles quadrilineatus]
MDDIIVTADDIDEMEVDSPDPKSQGGKSSKVSKAPLKRKFVSQWMEDPEFKDWITKGKDKLSGADSCPGRGGRGGRNDGGYEEGEYYEEGNYGGGEGYNGGGGGGGIDPGYPRPPPPPQEIPLPN